MSEQTSLVAVEIESEPTLFPQFSPTRFVGKKGVDPGNELDLNQGVGGGVRGDSPMKTENKRRRRNRRMCSECRECGLLAVLTVARRLSQSPFPISGGRSVGVLAVHL